MTIDRRKLDNVYWIGGGSRAGKSTIARRIAEEKGFDLYLTDDTMADHARRSNAKDHPLLARFLTMTMDERWVNRPPKEMFETFPWYHGECFEMIIDDISARPSEQPLLVEGFRILPELVLPYLPSKSHAVWLLPTPQFREKVVETSTDTAWAFLSKTSDRNTAISNVLKRDEMFTEHLSAETQRLGLGAIRVGPETSVQDLAQRVVTTLGLQARPS